MYGQKFEYATVEWLWDVGALRVNYPDGTEEKSTGSYTELNALLCQLGGQGWEAACSSTGGNWIFWTLKRQSV